MGTSGQSGRQWALVWLAGLVMVFGGASWFVTGGIGAQRTPPTHHDPANFTPGPTPTPVDCASNQLVLAGAFNECAEAVPDARMAAPDATIACSVSGHTLDVVLHLAGTNPDAFLLYLEVNGTYAGPGPYDLPPWPHVMGTKDDVPKVAIQQDGTSAFWQLTNGGPIQNYGTDDYWDSVAGILNVSGNDGRSGTVSAILEQSASAVNTSTVPGSTLSVNGPWSCT
jgi:hypothetical protein